MVPPVRKRKIIGSGLIVVGVLFLMVSNDIVFGWEDVWPLFAIFAGILLLRVYARSRTPEMLFGGVAATLLGVFFLLFSIGALGWERMDTLWPFIPLIAALSMLAVSVGRHGGTASLLVGVAALLFTVLGFLYEGGVVEERVAAPFVRFWPLVLVVAGVVMVKVKGKGEDPDMSAVREVLERDERPTADADPEEAKTPSEETVS